MGSSVHASMGAWARLVGLGKQGGAIGGWLAGSAPNKSGGGAIRDGARTGEGPWVVYQKIFS